MTSTDSRPHLASPPSSQQPLITPRSPVPRRPLEIPRPLPPDTPPSNSVDIAAAPITSTERPATVEPAAKPIDELPATRTSEGCTDLAAAAATKQEHVSVTGNGNEHQSLPAVSGMRTVEWRRGWHNLFFAGLAILLIIGCIVAAAVLAAKRVYKPLDWLGGGLVTLDSYNVVITIISNILSVAVGTAIGRGMQAVLRRRIISKEGLSLDNYIALVSFSGSNLHWRMRWTALFAFAIFLVAQVVGPASQAAFGYVDAQRNLTSPYRLACIANNIDRIDRLAVIRNQPSAYATGELDIAATLALTYTSPVARLGDFFEDATDGNPLFSTFGAQRTRITWSDNRQLKASSSRRILLPVEGFYAQASCVETSVPVNSTFTDTPSTTTFDFAFPCGLRRVFYSQQGPFRITFDSYGCPNSSEVFFFSVNSTSGTVDFVYACEVTTSSKVFSTNHTLGGAGSDSINGLFNAAIDPGTARATLDIPAAPVVGALSRAYFNTFGSLGLAVPSSNLPVFVDSPAEKGNERELLETLLSTTTRYFLASLNSYIWWQRQWQRIANWTQPVYTLEDGTVEISVLKIHLSGRELGWLTVPSLLLLLLFPLSYIFLKRDIGAIDLTNPSIASLIGISSPQNITVSGFAGKTTGSMKIRFGESTQDGGGSPKRLIFVAADAEKGLVGVEEPKRGRAYA